MCECQEHFSTVPTHLHLLPRYIQTYKERILENIFKNHSDTLYVELFTQNVIK